jgi:PilZ domain
VAVDLEGNQLIILATLLRGKHKANPIGEKELNFQTHPQPGSSFQRHLRRKNATEVTRRCLRYPMDWEVKTCNGHPVAQTLLLDISATGARIEGPQPLYQQRHFEFTYLMPGDDRQRRHAWKVMWMRPLVHEPGCYQMGVEFSQPNWSLNLKLCPGLVQ